MPGIMREWVTKLPLLMQGVLIAAVRGCDGALKEDPSKPLLRELRLIILRNARPLAVIKDKKMYMCPLPQDFGPGDKHFEELVLAMVKSTDHYPVHFLTHFMFACEIVGFKHPDIHTRLRWSGFYKSLVHSLHLHPETMEELDRRLGWQENDEIEEEPYPTYQEIK